ncbi:MAG: hypothetical protein WAO52_19015 [Prolixibacteraceae bacterium]
MKTIYINVILLTFSSVLFITYFLYIWFRHGVRQSLSDSYYALGKNRNFIFTLFWWFFMIPVMIVASTPLIFFAGSGICFVGASPAFRNRLEGKVHTISAVAGIFLSMLSLIIDFRYWISAVIFLILSLAIILSKIKNRTWWIEIAAILVFLVSLYFIKVIR